MNWLMSNSYKDLGFKPVRLLQNLDPSLITSRTICSQRDKEASPLHQGCPGSPESAPTTVKEERCPPLPTGSYTWLIALTQATHHMPGTLLSALPFWHRNYNYLPQEQQLRLREVSMSSEQKRRRGGHLHSLLCPHLIFCTTYKIQKIQEIIL